MVEDGVVAMDDDDVFDDLAESRQVEEALSELTDEQRRVLTEVYVRGRSVNETAHALDLPAPTVSKRAHFALRSLRAALERRGLAP